MSRDRETQELLEKLNIVFQQDPKRTEILIFYSDATNNMVLFAEIQPSTLIFLRRHLRRRLRNTLRAEPVFFRLSAWMASWKYKAMIAK